MGVQIPIRRGNFEGEGASHCKVGLSGHSAVICVKTAEPIETPFGLWTRVSRRKHKFNRIRQVAPMCPHWRHLANTIEPSISGGDAALCQIILIICFFSQIYGSSDTCRLLDYRINFWVDESRISE